MHPPVPAPLPDLAPLRAWMVEAGQLALRWRRQLDTRLKADGSPVTVVDLQVEAFLLERLTAQYPGQAVLSEERGLVPGSGGPESATRGRAEWLWVVDPLDGSRAYASGLPIWGVSVGLLWRGEPYAGAFYLPALDELYWADPQHSTCNGQPLPLRPPLSLDDPLAFLCVPSNAHLHFRIAYPRLRSLGSTAAHVMYVARGTALGALLRRVCLWDIAGVLPLLYARGGQLVYLSGAPCKASDLLDGRPSPKPILAAHSSVIEAVRARISCPPSCEPSPSY